MLVAFLALSSALSLAVTNICIRRGTRWASPNQGVVLSALIAPPVFVAIATVNGDLWRVDDVPAEAYALFAVAGVVHFVIGRALNFAAIRAIGASRSSVIVGATPIFAVALAIPILGESISWVVGVGAIIIMIGSVVMTRGGHYADPVGTSAAGIAEVPSAVTGTLLALGASFFWGVSPVLIKLGLDQADVPILGTLVATSAAGLFLGSFLGNPRFMREMVRMDRQAVLWFFLAGCLAAVAQIFRFLALSEGDVTLVVLIMQSIPLFVITLTVAVNRDFEVLNAFVFIGAVFVTVGAVIVTGWS